MVEMGRNWLLKGFFFFFAKKEEEMWEVLIALETCQILLHETTNDYASFTRSYGGLVGYLEIEEESYKS